MAHKEHVPNYKCLLPSSLDLAEIIRQNPPDFEPDLGLLTYLVHLTIDIPAKNKDLLSKNGFVPFNARCVQKKSRRYRQHLDYLVEQGVLDEDRQYIVGKTSRQFRIAEKYLSNRLKDVIITDIKLVRALERNSNIDFASTIKYKSLYQWFNPEKLKVDVERAEEYIYNELAQNKEKNYYSAYISAYTKILKVKLISEGAFWFHVDDFGHRLHTNMTNLNKDLKQFITYEGQNLVSIDIKNSQPFFSLKILNEYYPLPIIPINPSIENRDDSNSSNSNTIMIVNKAETLDFTDVSRYRGEVVKGTLYDLLESEMRKEYGDEYFTRPYIYDVSKGRVVRNTFTPRQIVKGDTYQVFFCKNDSHSNKAKCLFTRLFPNVMKAFEEIKGNDHIALEDRHKRLAKMLQRIESSVILGKVVKEISRIRPELPIYTIHDSIVTTIGNEEFVQHVMEKVIKSEMGAAPSLKPEYWCNDCGVLMQAA